jgi:hypothetical protein
MGGFQSKNNWTTDGQRNYSSIELNRALKKLELLCNFARLDANTEPNRVV